jgi:hypothetical protein
MPRWPVLAATLLLTGAPAAPAAAQRAEFAAQLTTAERNAPSGLKIHVRFRPADGSEGKPSPLRSAVIRGPKGLRFDTKVLPECTASDSELELLGSDACPSDSRLALGAFSAMTGFGAPVDPLGGDLHVFNGPAQMIEVITAPGTSASPAFDRLTIEGSTLTAHPPDAAGGPPDGKSSVRSLDYEFGPVVNGGRSYLTTPRRCRRGVWTITGTFGFADGTTTTVKSRNPCRKPRAKRG